MKTEHRDIIDRARLAGLPPSYLAHELLVHDLVEAGLFELKNLHSPYGKLNEGQQQEVIDRLTEAAEKAVHNAISIISSRNVSTIEVTMKEVKFNSKQLTLTSIVDAKDPNRHDLIDSAGRICLLVMAPDDYNDGLDFIQPDRDQHDLPLHVSDLTGSLFDKRPTGADEPDGQDHPLGTAEDLAERTGTNSAASEFAEVGKEFGEFTYDDAAQLIVLKASDGFGVDWMQSRLAISSDQATTLLLRLIDNEVVELVTEGDTSTDNTYKVIATLDDLGPNLSVE
ncbi:DNA translocase FtsK [Pseudomonas proteolytica]|uniref:DNA translocase FtsK n=1 Tax=Pseudomonas proteolytica TaxID=219574 RepID=UPI00147568A6|nr:DNA translocase FtsK [Pseudomonas proteolytica]NMZ06256.1 DNA translocase FtsK [Pseudomonas proteolytica]